ncbi:NHSL1 protein, partial [Nyctibius grandis]|nr:NHSL1 protein [Nyctibius grandis]
ATSNLDLESKKAARAKLPWQQPVNVFLAAGRPPGMEQLHQEAQLNLQSLLRVRAYGECWGGGGGCLEGLGGPFVSHPQPFDGHVPLPPQPPSHQATEEETAGTTAASLSLPTSPDKPPAWPRASPLPTVEERQWHQSCAIQANVVPINVS